MDGRRVAAGHRLRERALALQVVGVDDAHEAEVEEADAVVVEQQVVAGMRVAARAPRVLERAEEEAEDDLAEAVALGLVELLDLLEAAAVEHLGHEHAAPRAAGVDGRDEDERVVAPGARHRAMVLGLDLVVELVADPFAQLLRERLDVQAGGEPLDQRQQHLQVAQVGLDRLGDARVLDLDRDPLALGGRRAVDLADRGGGERVVLEVVEEVFDRLAQLRLEQLLHALEGQRRDVVAQARERGLELLALGLGDRGEVDGREDLADLHRRAAHLAELLDQLAGGRGRALAGRGVGGLVAAQGVDGARSGPAQALAGDEPAEAAGAGDAGGGRGVGHSEKYGSGNF